MNIIPAIDLKQGRCVRLTKGDFTQITYYPDSPRQVAEGYSDAGASELHIVDLDGAEQSLMSQQNVIQAIAQTTMINIQTGGGIRDAEQIKTLLENGAQRIVIGSLAVKQPLLVQSWLNEFGSDKLVLAFDVRFINNDYYCATQGWSDDSKLSLWECLKFYKNLKHCLCTDINRDGTLKGPNFALYQKIKQEFPDVLLQASGGISCLNDLKQLEQLDIDGVIIGKALFEKKFTLAEAMGYQTC